MIQILLIAVVFYFLGYYSKSKKIKSNNSDELIFQSSFSRGGNLIVPEKLVFDKNNVTWKKNHGLDYLYANTTTITIPLKNIVGFRVHKNVIGCDIEIVGKGFQSIMAKNFTNNDANEIEKLVNSITQYN